MRNTPFSGESTDSSDNESSCGDYCTPPDELSPTKDQLISKQAKDGLEETTQVLKTCATYTTVSLKKVRDLDFKLSVFVAFHSSSFKNVDDVTSYFIYIALQRK